MTKFAGKLKQLERRFQRTRAGKYFGLSSRQAAAKILDDLEQLIDDIDEAAAQRASVMFDKVIQVLGDTADDEATDIDTPDQAA